MMKYSITHRGVPIGDVYLTSTETAVGELLPAAGYSGVRDVIRSASEALWAAGFLSSAGSGTDVDPSALGRAAALPLELRDELGSFVPADFINIVERPTAGDPPVVFVRFRLAPGHVGSLRRARGAREGDSKG